MRQIRKSSEPEHFSKWKKDFMASHSRRAVYDDLIGTDEYLRLKEGLVEEQGYICCYCEKRIGKNKYLMDCDIEHFMPRHPDRRTLSKEESRKCVASQLDYTNLLASCKGENAYSADHCNHRKDNWFSFETCVSPTDIQINDIFGFKLDGRIFAKDIRGQEMAKHLNLSSYVLEEQRKAAFDTVLELEFEDEDLLSDRDYVEAVIEDYDNQQNGEFAEFCSMITYCLREYFMPL